MSARMNKTYMRIGMKKVQFLKKTVSSCQKESAKPSGSNSSPRLRFVLELRGTGKTVEVKMQRVKVVYR